MQQLEEGVHKIYFHSCRMLSSLCLDSGGAHEHCHQCCINYWMNLDIKPFKFWFCTGQCTKQGQESIAGACLVASNNRKKEPTKHLFTEPTKDMFTQSKSQQNLWSLR